LEAVDGVLEQGHSLREALAEAGCFTRDFLDAVAVGEESGRLVEALALQTRQYREQARSATATLTTLAGFVVWAIVAVFIIVMIFRLATFYFSALGGGLA
jgi:type II secretory pathway component PulF